MGHREYFCDQTNVGKYLTTMFLVWGNSAKEGASGMAGPWCFHTNSVWEQTFQVGSTSVIIYIEQA